MTGVADADEAGVAVAAGAGVSSNPSIRGSLVPSPELPVDRPRRSLDEELLVRFPSLARCSRSAWGRLPLRSKLRRALLRRMSMQAMGAVNRRDFDVLLTGFDPKIDYRMTEGSALMPDLVGHHYGHAGYRAVWDLVLESFSDLRSESTELIDFGNVLVATTVYAGHGVGSGVPISTRLHQVLTLHNGLVVKQEDFVDRDEALRAAAAELRE